MSEAHVGSVGAVLVELLSAQQPKQGGLTSGANGLQLQQLSRSVTERHKRQKGQAGGSVLV